MRQVYILFLTLLLTFLTGCAGREPQLIETKSDRDDKMDCMTVLTEISNCEVTIIEKYHDGKKAVSNTISSAVVGCVIFPPALFFMDLKQAQPNNFVVFRPKKKFVRIDLRIPKEPETENKIEEAGLDLMEYSRTGRTRIKLTKKEIKEQEELLTGLIKMAYEQSIS